MPPKTKEEKAKEKEEKRKTRQTPPPNTQEEEGDALPHSGVVETTPAPTGPVGEVLQDLEQEEEEQTAEEEETAEEERRAEEEERRAEEEGRRAEEERRAEEARREEGARAVQKEVTEADASRAKIGSQMEVFIGELQKMGLKMDKLVPSVHEQARRQEAFETALCRLQKEVDEMAHHLRTLKDSWTQLSPAIDRALSHAVATDGFRPMEGPTNQGPGPTVARPGPNTPRPEQWVAEPTQPAMGHHVAAGTRQSGEFGGRRNTVKVPKFDGKSCSLDSWLTQFRAISKYNHWDEEDKSLMLVTALEGQAANIVIGMSDAQLDNFGYMLDKLRERFDPAHREGSHRAQFRARTRRRSEEADEFAEALKMLAGKAYTSLPEAATQELVMDQFRGGHQADPELALHLSLSSATTLADLVAAAVKYETACRLHRPTQKPPQGLAAVQPTSAHMTVEQVREAARKLGFGLRPWVERNQDANRGPPPSQNRPTFGRGRNPAPPPRPNQRTSNRPRKDFTSTKCWNCGQLGHTQWICSAPKSGLKFAPDTLPSELRVSLISGERFQREGETDGYSVAGSMLHEQDEISNQGN